MLIFNRFFIFLIFSLVLTGCMLSVDNVRPTHIHYLDKTDPKWQIHLAQIKQIKSYHIQGQIGYLDRKQRASVTFDWQYHSPNEYTLTLSSILSRSLFILEKKNREFIITDEKGKSYNNSNAQHLLEETLGIMIPIDQLAIWLKGDPNAQLDYQVGENHLLASFTYSIYSDEWTVDYLNYHNSPIPLPQDILLKNTDQTLKIRVNNWKYQ
ncbi:lipoprotein insertase outer membrane protein LolB [Avibacterium paragallinarum]|uniref:lipoprotein insertase outer membrane protein LolB n=2 Tax=Avibacterium paragallinarum TaxID=728 RepID=UPI001028D1A4|nr:lipoprotein insertase outer membrane protein LolB [Avibacterium paragallinarum]RZN59782.1 lipoprotein localization protein LolB [Avibacterium paragallinarum]TID24670.1 membrane protein [Avibacterium paragallinarum]